MRRRQAHLAEEFAAALEGRGPARVATDPTLGPLVAMARGLQALPLGPTPDFRGALRDRLLAAAVLPAPVAPPAPWQQVQERLRGWRMQRLVSVTAGAMAAMVGVAGVGTAASRSVPGDPFYGMKRSVEALQVNMARNPVNAGKRHLQHAETRLAEIGRLVGRPLALVPVVAEPGEPTALALGGSRAARVIATLRDMDEDTRAGTRLLTRAYARGRQEEPLRALARFASRQESGLRRVLPALPPPARDEAAASIALVGEVESQATTLLTGSTCEPDCPAPEEVPVAAPPAPAPASTPQPAAQVFPTPVPDAADPPADPGHEPAAEPEPTVEPSPEPSPAPEPEPTQSPSPAPEPSPTPSPSPSGTVPTVVPSPVRSPVEEIVGSVPSAAPTSPPPLP